MSLARKISQNTAIVYGQTLITLVFGAASAFLIIRSLERYQFGIFSLAMSAVWLIMPWLDFGIGQVVSADVAGYIGSSDFAKVKRLLFGFYKTKIFLALVATSGTIVVSYFLPARFDPQFASLFRLGSFIILVNSVLSVMLVTFESHAQFFFTSIAQIVESILRFIAVIILVMILKMGSQGVMLSYIIATSFAVLVALPMLLKTLRPIKKIPTSPDPVFKNLVKGHGKFQAFTQPLKSMAENLQVWIIGWLAGINAVAIYQVAIQIYNYIAMFLSASESVLMPILSQELNRSIEKGKMIIERMSKYVFWLASIIMLAAFLIIPWAIRLLFGHKYDASILPFYIILLALPLAGLSVPYRPAFFAFKGQRQLLKIHLWVIITTYPVAAILTFWLRDINGALGFAIIFPAVALMALVLRVYFLKFFLAGFNLRMSRLFVLDQYDGELLRRIGVVLRKKIFFLKV